MTRRIGSMFLGKRWEQLHKLQFALPTRCVSVWDNTAGREAIRDAATVLADELGLDAIEIVGVAIAYRVDENDTFKRTGPVWDWRDV